MAAPVDSASSKDNSDSEENNYPNSKRKFHEREYPNHGTTNVYERKSVIVMEITEARMILVEMTSNIWKYVKNITERKWTIVKIAVAI